ncbi:MAG TPA: glucosamine-6-phosphate deaminase [Pseudogracilibacillus sp.]|nr:glucosamine-6-phosphate deaminase [Pseudogracilibacillus sp.]
MEIIVCKDNNELSYKASEFVTDIVNRKENPVLGLATGSTPEKLYELLIEENKQGNVSFDHATSFNLDEYVGLDANDVNSYRYFMDEHLFNHIDINKENTHIPNGLSTDMDTACRDYEAQIKAAGPIDVQILGLGLNGHIGFNEPGTDFSGRTRVVDLDETTREANARFFNSIDEVPTQAITMGIASIMEAEKILLLVQGEKKAAILKEVINGEVTNQVPASILQNHPNVTVLTDVLL